ncbi:hypothetical protein CYMTET_30820 [Cymbomonas tetramitiformis]|uniref:RCK N-terminal domain-containing protein n=1 Tax=Cymbomonas tetramitiformis TaxID=36881 RepID=A0AAE0KTT7_9CHLO|nr:hypothetical protein CYMTET_30820 [Cymbomonas tetramitiformis]
MPTFGKAKKKKRNSLLSSQPDLDELMNSWEHSTLARTSQNVVNRISTIEDHDMAPDNEKVEEVTLMSMTQNGGHIVLVALHDYLWDSITSFIRPLRAPYLMKWMDIVVLCKFRPPPTLHKLFHRVLFVKGDPFMQVHMNSLRVQSAAWLVTFDGRPPSFEKAMMDQRSILFKGIIHGELEKSQIRCMMLLQSPLSFRLLGATLIGQRLEQHRKKGNPQRIQAKMQIKARPSDQKIFRTSLRLQNFLKEANSSQNELAREGNNQELTADNSAFERAATFIKRSFGAPAALVLQSFNLRNKFNERLARLKEGMVAERMNLPHTHPQFASGSCFSMSDLARLFAFAFYTPGILELVNALAFPTPPDDYSIHEMAVVWDWPLPEKFWDATFGDLMDYCLQRNVVPFAVHRAGTGNAPNSVISGPQSILELHSRDHVMVLATIEWASKNIYPDHLGSVLQKSAAIRKIQAQWRGSSEQDRRSPPNSISRTASSPTIMSSNDLKLDFPESLKSYPVVGGDEHMDPLDHNGNDHTVLSLPSMGAVSAHNLASI